MVYCLPLKLLKLCLLDLMACKMACNFTSALICVIHDICMHVFVSMYVILY